MTESLHGQSVREESRKKRDKKVRRDVL